MKLKRINDVAAVFAVVLMLAAGAVITYQVVQRHRPQAAAAGPLSSGAPSVAAAAKAAEQGASGGASAKLSNALPLASPPAAPGPAGRPQPPPPGPASGPGHALQPPSPQPSPGTYEVDATFGYNATPLCASTQPCIKPLSFHRIDMYKGTALVGSVTTNAFGQFTTFLPVGRYTLKLNPETGFTPGQSWSFSETGQYRLVLSFTAGSAIR